MKIINTKNLHVQMSPLTYCVLAVAIFSVSTGNGFGQFTRGGYTSPRTLFYVDSDGDGLTDKYEISIGTNPNHQDSDGDGLLDNREVDAGTNPTISDDPITSDSDNDGITNAVELWFLLSDPLSSDTDGDGIPDLADMTMDELLVCTEESTKFSNYDFFGWNWGIDVNSVSIHLIFEADGDGLSTFLEEHLGTDPHYRFADKDRDGIVDYEEIFDGIQGGINQFDAILDTDGDGVPNYEDSDDDGDGLETINELGYDSNGNGIPSHLDTGEKTSPYYEYDMVFLANAGEDKIADAGEIVELHPGKCRGPHPIVNFKWTRIVDQNILQDGSISLASTIALGCIEEVWELEIEDTMGNIATDRVSIFSRQHLRALILLEEAYQALDSN